MNRFICYACPLPDSSCKEADLNGFVKYGKAKFQKLSDLVLMTSVFATSLENSTASDYWTYGVEYRLEEVSRSVGYFLNEFPELYWGPTKTLENLSDSQRYLHMYYIHMCGLMDDLAWVYCYEHGISDSLDLVRDRDKVSLFREKFFRNFEENSPVVALMKKYRAWYDYLTDVKAAVCHRIPPRISPRHCLNIEVGYIRVPFFYFVPFGEATIYVNLYCQFFKDMIILTGLLNIYIKRFRCINLKR